MGADAINHLELYRPIDNQDRGWGVRIDDVGYARVPPGSEYPPRRHPAPYMFSWERGRVLDNYHVVFIGKGRGILETAHADARPVTAGSAFLLFPGEWHRYRPDDTTGWTERWCGFSGSYADQVLRSFFSVQHPILSEIPVSRVRRRMRLLTRIFERGVTADVPQLVAELVGLLTDLSVGMASKQSSAAKSIGFACDKLRVDFRKNVDLEALAGRLGMSYPLFRRLFKQQMGYSPHAYVLAFRMNYAKMLLAKTKESLQDVARESGFSTLSYFTRMFGKFEGCTPRQWRIANQRTA